MLFSLNEFLMAVSFTLDFIEMDLLGVTSNHGKRTAYMSLRVAKELGLSPEQLHDIVALAILHDNGVSEKSLHDEFLAGESIDIRSIERVKEHCTIGEENVKQYPFLTDVQGVIKYHHEKFNGTGFFKLKGNDIPLMSQIIHFADIIEVNFDLENINIQMQAGIIEFIYQQEDEMFSSSIARAFLNISKNQEFWESLSEDCVDRVLRASTPKYSMELSYEEIRKITGVLSKIVDSKSQYTQRHSSDLADKIAVMAEYYNFEHDEKMKLIIAANMHDIGKLAVPNRILDSPNKLTEEEFNIVKKHSYYTRLALQEIKGFEDITEWASNLHEKLNGQGYPFGKTAEELDFNSRLMACLDIYEALTEDRPYRRPLDHRTAMDIMNKLKEDGAIDSGITEDINVVFGGI